MAVSEEQALKETFIQIHDFLLSQSCKKAAASLVKDAPAVAGLATRTPAPSTSKLVNLVKSDLEKTSAATASSSVLKAAAKTNSDSSSSEDSSSDGSSDSSSEDQGPAAKTVSAAKGKFAAVPPPAAVATSAVKAVTSTPKKAVQIVLPSSESSSSEDDLDSDSSDVEDEKKPPVKPAAVQPKANVASSNSGSSSEESSSSDESSDDEEELPKTTQTKVPISKASTVKPAALAPAQAESSSDSSDSEDSSSDDEPTPAVKAAPAAVPVNAAKASAAPSSSDSSDSSEESSSDDEAAPPAIKAKAAAQSTAKSAPAANGPFGGFVKAAQNAVQHAVEATVPHMNGKPVAGQKRKASASSSSSSSDSSDSDSSSDEDLPPAKKTQTVQGGVTKATTTVQIPASAAASVQVSRMTEIVPEAESAATSGASTPMNADRAALINGPAVAAGLAKGKKGQNTPWRRVRAEEHTVDDRLKDNSFLGKGGSHNKDYGYKAAQDLIVTRGDSFRKEKNKKKRGSYRGGEISMQSYSIKFDD